jgi:hypothetical protein
VSRISDQSDGKTGRTGKAVERVRTRAAQVIRIVFTVCAAMLALGALLIALRHNINDTNPIVKFVRDFCDAIDGPFGRDSGIFTFHGKNAAAKEALVNWGIAAVVYLALGRVLERIVKP